MNENQDKNEREVNIGNGNYNESIGRDNVEGNIYYNNYNINVPQEESVTDLEKQSSESWDSKSKLTINSSGNWVLINDYFFKSTTIRIHSDNTITVKINSESPEDDANIRSLRPDRYRYGHSGTISFAYHNDGFFVRVESIEEEFKGDICIWSITLKPTDIQYGGNVMEPSYSSQDCYYSATDIAKLRGTRILLNDPPKPSRDSYYSFSDVSMFVESLISSPFINRDIKINGCILKELYNQFKDQPQKYLKISRLAAIFNLKAANVVEQILELSLELIDPDKVRVKFRGRRKVALDLEPAIIEIEGDCPLI